MYPKGLRHKNANEGLSGYQRAGLRGHFENRKKIHLSEELQKGPREVNLYAWFGVQR